MTSLTVWCRSSPGFGRLMAWSLALSAWVSILPYFFWSHRQLALVISGMGIGAVGTLALWARRQPRLERRDVIAGLTLVLFLTYISLQRTVAGGHALWVFVVPTVLGLVTARADERKTAYDILETLFVLSLIPGLILLTLMIAGVPLTLSLRPPANPRFALEGIRMLEGIGAVFLENNSQVLPWGGVVSRLCAMYDEPGMVGTIAALMLAVRGFAVRDWRSILLWTAGIASLSLAFVVLTVLGFAVCAVLRRDWRPILLAVPIGLAGLFTLGWIRIPVSPTTVSRLTVEVGPKATVPGDVGAPVVSRDAAAGEMLVNGDFSSDMSGWILFGQITSQVTEGVFEFHRADPPDPAGAILQATGQTLEAGNVLTANFDLGNSSTARKRVTVLLHDLEFGDVAACTISLKPRQALSAYTMRALTAKDWRNATISFYAATADHDQFAQLDNVSLRRTPQTAVSRTECVGSGAAAPALPARMGTTTAPAQVAGQQVRQTAYVNNRSLPEMDALVARYYASDWRTIAFGMASDASVVYGGASAVWTRVLTNHGVLGFVLVASVFLGYAATAVRRTTKSVTMLLFLLCFALSFYQRPVIWLPYALLLFFGGLAKFEDRAA